MNHRRRRPFDVAMNYCLRVFCWRRLPANRKISELKKAKRRRAIDIKFIFDEGAKQKNLWRRSLRRVRRHQNRRASFDCNFASFLIEIHRVIIVR